MPARYLGASEAQKIGEFKVIIIVFRYDLKDKSKLVLQDIQFFAAMGPPGGGRNDVTARFLRHFQVIGMNPFNDETMIKIFSTIMNAHLRVCICL